MLCLSFRFVIVCLKPQCLLAHHLVVNKESVPYFIDERLLIKLVDSRRVGLVFCDFKLADLPIRKVMNYDIPVIVGIKGKIAMDSENREKITILVFTNSEIAGLTEECVSSISQGLLVFKTTLIIYDVPFNSSANLSKGGNNWHYLRSANVLYLMGDECWQMSPPYMFNRTLSKSHACKIWQYNLDNIPDMQGQTIEAVTFHRPLSTIINVNETDPAKRYDGMEMNIFIEISKQLNLSWKINELEHEVDQFGQLIDGHWVGGLMEALTSGTAEVGFSNIWESPEHLLYLDFVTSWMTASTVFLVPRPTLSSSSWNSLLRPFSGPLWFGFGLAILFFPLLTWTFACLHYSIKRKQKPKAYSIGCAYLSIFSSVTGGSGFPKERQCPLRMLASFWLLFIFLMFSAYTCNIVAHISLPSLSPKINSVQQMVQENFSWGRPQGEQDLDDLLDFQKYWHRRFAKNVRVYSNSEQRGLVVSRKFAILAVWIDDSRNLILDMPLEEDLTEMLTVLKEPIRTYRCAIALRKHSPLMPSFDKLLQRFIESGLVLYLKDNSVLRYQNGAYRKMTVDTQLILQSHGMALTLTNFKLVFYFLLFGWVLTVICFIVELLLGFYHQISN